MCLLFFLILSGGIILDKMGIRFTIITSGVTMVIGGSIKYFALSKGFVGSGIEQFLSSFLVNIPASAKLAFFWFCDIRRRRRNGWNNCFENHCEVV